MGWALLLAVLMAPAAALRTNVTCDLSHHHRWRYRRPAQQSPSGGCRGRRRDRRQGRHPLRQTPQGRLS